MHIYEQRDLYTYARVSVWIIIIIMTVINYLISAHEHLINYQLLSKSLSFEKIYSRNSNVT